MSNILRRLVWGKHAGRYEHGLPRYRVMTGYRWDNLKNDMYDALPRKEATKALKLLLRYERYMLAK